LFYPYHFQEDNYLPMRKTMTLSRFTNFGRKINVIMMLSLIRIDFKKANAIRSMFGACSICCVLLTWY